MEKVQEEIEEVMGGREDITEEDLGLFGPGGINQVPDTIPQGNRVIIPIVSCTSLSIGFLNKFM